MCPPLPPRQEIAGLVSQRAAHKQMLCLLVLAWDPTLSTAESCPARPAVIKGVLQRPGKRKKSKRHENYAGLAAWRAVRKAIETELSTMTAGLKTFQANVARGASDHDIALSWLPAKAGSGVVLIREPWTSNDRTKTHLSFRLDGWNMRPWALRPLPESQT